MSMFSFDSEEFEFRGEYVVKQKFIQSLLDYAKKNNVFIMKRKFHEMHLQDLVALKDRLMAYVDHCKQVMKELDSCFSDSDSNDSSEDFVNDVVDSDDELLTNHCSGASTAIDGSDNNIHNNNNDINARRFLINVDAGEHGLHTYDKNMPTSIIFIGGSFDKRFLKSHKSVLCTDEIKPFDKLSLERHNLSIIKAPSDDNDYEVFRYRKKYISDHIWKFRGKVIIANSVVEIPNELLKTSDLFFGLLTKDGCKEVSSVSGYSATLKTQFCIQNSIDFTQNVTYENDDQLILAVKLFIQKFRGIDDSYAQYLCRGQKSLYKDIHKVQGCVVKYDHATLNY